MPPRPTSIFLRTALAETSRLEPLSGSKLVLRRLAHRPLAAAYLFLPGTAKDGPLPALTLIAAGRSFAAAVALPPGARLELVQTEALGFALLLESTTEDFPGLFASLAATFGGPAPDKAAYLAAIRDLERAALEESVDPERLAARAAGGVGALGDRTALTGLSHAALEAFWNNAATAPLPSFAVCGDLDIETLGRTIFAALYRRAAVRAATGEGDRASGGGVASDAVACDDAARSAVEEGRSLVIAPPGARSATLVARFASQGTAAEERGARAVALRMLERLLAAELALKGEDAAQARATEAACGVRLCITGLANAASGEAAVFAAVRRLCEGECLSLDTGGTATIESELSAYKALALSTAYGNHDAARDIAAAIAEDLARGGDGSGPARLADDIEAATPLALLRASRRAFESAPRIGAVVPRPGAARPRAR